MKLIHRLENVHKGIMLREDFEQQSSVKEVIANLREQESTEPASNEEIYILLKAMINATKSGGKIYVEDQRKIIGFMKDMSKVEQMFVEYELNQQFNIKSFLKEIPKGMERQVYYMSLFSVDLDVEAQRDYLDMLAKGLKLTDKEINHIHKDLGFTALLKN